MPHRTPCATAKPCQLKYAKAFLSGTSLSVCQTKGKTDRAMLARDAYPMTKCPAIGINAGARCASSSDNGVRRGVRSRHAICRMKRRRKEMAEFFVQAQKAEVCSLNPTRPCIIITISPALPTTSSYSTQNPCSTDTPYKLLFSSSLLILSQRGEMYINGRLCITGKAAARRREAIQILLTIRFVSPGAGLISARGNCRMAAS